MFFELEDKPEIASLIDVKIPDRFYPVQSEHEAKRRFTVFSRDHSIKSKKSIDSKVAPSPRHYIPQNNKMSMFGNLIGEIIKKNVEK